MKSATAGTADQGGERGVPTPRSDAAAQVPGATAHAPPGERWLSHGVLLSRSALAVVIGAIVVVAGQAAEDLLDSPPLQLLPPAVYIPRWTVILVTAYMLVSARVLDVTVRRSLPSLRPAVRIDDATFEAYAQRMRNPGRRLEAALLLASAGIVSLLFLVLRADLPLRDPVTNDPMYLPGDALASVAVLGAYVVLGWAGLSIFVASVRLARTLGSLSREPLAIDVFDTTNLLPFGSIALAVALAPAGIIVILLLGLGSPSTWYSWTILLLATTASLLALLQPLRGIHVQMARAKQAVLADLDRRISQVYRQVADVEVGATKMARLNEATSTLIPLRRTVHDMTTWPFRDTVAFGRAVLIASAPLVYAVLSELIRVFWIEPMGR